MLAIITILCITAVLITALCFYKGIGDYELDEIFQKGYEKGYADGIRDFLYGEHHEEITKGEGTE